MLGRVLHVGTWRVDVRCVRCGARDRACAMSALCTRPPLGFWCWFRGFSLWVFAICAVGFRRGFFGVSVGILRVIEGFSKLCTEVCAKGFSGTHEPLGRGGGRGYTYTYTYIYIYIYIYNIPTYIPISTMTMTMTL